MKCVTFVFSFWKNENSFKHLDIKFMALCPGSVDTPFFYGERSHLYLIKEFADKSKENIKNMFLQT